MINAGLLFALASLIAVTAIVVSFKQLIGDVQNRLSESPELTQDMLRQEFTRFFIKVAIVEALPILLIVLGFVQIGGQEGTFTLMEVLPSMVIVAILLAVGIFNVFIARQDTISLGSFSTQTKTMINTVCMIGLSLISAIPIVSFVALLTMMK